MPQLHTSASGPSPVTVAGTVRALLTVSLSFLKVWTVTTRSSSHLRCVLISVVRTLLRDLFTAGIQSASGICGEVAGGAPFSAGTVTLKRWADVDDLLVCTLLCPSPSFLSTGLRECFWFIHTSSCTS